MYGNAIICKDQVNTYSYSRTDLQYYLLHFLLFFIYCFCSSFTFLFSQLCMSVYMCASTHACTCRCMHVHVCERWMYMYVYVHICVQAHGDQRSTPLNVFHICIYICTYIHTHIYLLFLIYILIIFPIVRVSVCAWADVCMFFSVALSWAIMLDWLASKLQESSFLNWAAISFPASPVRDSLCWTTQYWLNQSDKLLSNVDSQIVLLLREPWLLQPLLLLHRVPGLGLSLAG